MVFFPGHCYDENGLQTGLESSILEYISRDANDMLYTLTYKVLFQIHFYRCPALRSLKCITFYPLCGGVRRTTAKSISYAFCSDSSSRLLVQLIRHFPYAEPTPTPTPMPTPTPTVRSGARRLQLVCTGAAVSGRRHSARARSPYWESLSPDTVRPTADCGSCSTAPRPAGAQSTGAGPPLRTRGQTAAEWSPEDREMSLLYTLT